MGNHFCRAQLFHPDYQQPLYRSNIKLEENELPIFECCTGIGYLLLTTKYLVVELQEQLQKVQIEKIMYQPKQQEIIKRKNNRYKYIEYDFYSLITDDNRLITYAVDTANELILDKCLTDISWMVEKFRKVHISKK